MTTEFNPKESKMLELVRIWRERAYELNRASRPTERADRVREILRRYGLGLSKSRRGRKPPQSGDVGHPLS